MQKLSQKTQGIVYVLVAAFGFSLMSMFIKLAGDLPSFEKAFFRNFVALIFITILMLRSRTSFRPERRNLPALFGRCFFGTLGLLCNFYAIGKLNLPDANMLNKLSPFFAILFSIFLLREKPNLVQVLGVLVAFGGSVCIIKPSFDNPRCSRRWPVCSAGWARALRIRSCVISARAGKTAAGSCFTSQRFRASCACRSWRWIMRR